MTARAVKRKVSLDLTDALVLLSCVSQKLSEPAPARLLYRSEWFTKVRTLVDSQKADRLILSALYCVVAPDTCIALMKRPSIELVWLSAALGQKMSGDSWLRV